MNIFTPAHLSLGVSGKAATGRKTTKAMMPKKSTKYITKFAYLIISEVENRSLMSIVEDSRIESSK
jgi:hypothetical protein